MQNGTNENDTVEVLEFDVAEDANRFIFDQDVTYDDGMPTDGSSFITRGYLYEAGTLNDSNGVNMDGSPEFLDQVIGEWICQGYMINDAGHATGGVWVFSTQFFQLDDEPGVETIVTQGYELADVDVAISRAITGGTGMYTDVSGEGTQTLLGPERHRGREPARQARSQHELMAEPRTEVSASRPTPYNCLWP